MSLQPSPAIPQIRVVAWNACGIKRKIDDFKTSIIMSLQPSPAIPQIRVVAWNACGIKLRLGSVVEGRSYSQAAAAITWTESQQQLKSNTPVTKNSVKAPSRTPRSALKKVQNPAPTNISAMLDVLQAMSQQINMLTNILMTTLPSNILMTTLPSETSRHASS
ncbi:hypothetical protein QE152_g18938 [Popillia japonica]|uniref:Uncharacterized protein n=1 Tax=Popillia japonica TaxID=7064 RepID=A0AAW1L483_POPJA